MGSSHLPPRPYSQASYSSRDAEEGQSLIPVLEKSPTNSGSLMRVITLWPLILHGIVAISIAALMMHYVDGNHFNFKERNPLVVLADGSTSPWGRYALLQSDITTFISISLAALRLITAAWLGPLCWRCAFILMEKTGMQPRQLYNMIGYGIPSLPRRGGKLIGWLVWMILATVLPVHIVAPVLTGSVTWIPNNRPMDRPSQSSIPVPVVTKGTGWRSWNSYPLRRERASIEAAGLASIAWGRESQNGVMKRVLPSAGGLEINSTISNVTLPYFSVTKVQWVEDVQTLSAQQRSVRGFACTQIQLYNGSECPLIRGYGAVALVPSTPAGWVNRTLPSPSTVSETRLMVLYTYWRKKSKNTCQPLFDGFPSNIDILGTGGTCWAFAWVTYTAGAGACSRCRISSYATVQNDEELAVREDPMTSEALFMMPSVIGMMVLMNTSIPSPRKNLDEYVIALLSRSYAVSWAAATNWIGELDSPSNTTYYAALPSSRALVDSRRVYVWLSVQLLVTTSGILFLWVRSGTSDSMMKDTTLAAFYIDSSDVYEIGKYHRLDSNASALLRLGYENGRPMVKVD